VFIDVMLVLDELVLDHLLQIDPLAPQCGMMWQNATPNSPSLASWSSRCRVNETPLVLMIQS
jgi:hypothetical protein